MMRTRLAGMLLAVAGSAAAASAQFITSSWVTARLDLDWQEDSVFPHNDNGVLEPGERALMLMTVSFTHQFTWVEVFGFETFLGGTILGLCNAYVDIRGVAGDAAGLYNGGITNPASSSTGPNAGSAGTSGYGVRGGWRVGGDVANGQPVVNGMMNMGPGQLPTHPSVANQTNPVANIERLGWEPSSYAQRTQTFTVAGAMGTSNNSVVGLYLDLDGGTTGGGAYLLSSRITFGSVNIPIAPAPAGLGLLAIAGLCRRRRRAVEPRCTETSK